MFKKLSSEEPRETLASADCEDEARGGKSVESPAYPSKVQFRAKCPVFPHFLHLSLLGQFADLWP